jgi:hypothetical protein
MFATLYVPNFYLQAALRHQSPAAEIPVGLIDEEDKKVVLIQLNTAAEAAGVTKGMTPSQGLARCLSLVIKARSLPQEKSIQDILLHYAFTLTPYVENSGPGLCTVQLTDWRHMIDKVSRAIEQLAKSEIVAQAGLGPTPDLSFLAAHLARPVLQIENAEDFLAPLPIETLAISAPNVR